ncbi:MAG: ATP-binding protein [Clostridia bacterium]|nr:ATP-binding protein [Clostridia bacterium]
MFAEAIKRIERQYEIRRNQADAAFLSEKKAIYESTPRLSEIDKEITKLGIQTAKLSIRPSSVENQKEIENLQSKIISLKNVKEDILKELNVNLVPKYSCHKCNDTGYVINDGLSEMCSCMRQELLNEAYNKSNMHSLKTETFANLDLNLFSDIPNPTKYKSDISPRENVKKILNISEDFIKNFDNPKQKNLLFTGSTGIGKTYISSCIANEIIKSGYNVLYQTSPLLLDNIFNYKYSNNKFNASSSNDLYNSLFNVNLLIIDDLGTENLTAAKFSEIFTILNARLITPNTKTIISTNFSLEELSKMYDSRILSRLIGHFNICRFFGEDIRMKQ